RDSTQAEAAGGDGHAVEQQSLESRLGVGIDFLHAPPIEARGRGSRMGGTQSGGLDAGFGAFGVVGGRFPRHTDSPNPTLAIGAEHGDSAGNDDNVRSPVEAR